MAHLTDEPVHLELDQLPIQDLEAGGGGWPLKPNRQEEWAWVSNIFTPNEIKSIIAIGESNEMSRARTGGPQKKENRDSFVKFLFPNDTTGWIFEKLAVTISEMNDMYWQFDLSGLDQGLQFTRYEAPGEHYDWHCDRGMGTGQRKLSITVQLSDPDDYEGGDLELRFGKEPMKAQRDQGMATLFPSYTLHRVTPLTKGTRYSLVAWVSGPPFK